MARKKKTDHAVETQHTPLGDGGSQANEPAAGPEQRAEAQQRLEDVVREVKAKLGGEVIEGEASPKGSAASQEKAASGPEPHELDSIELGPDKGSPRMRLLRSHRYQQMQIRFDEKPSDAVRELLHGEGWRWRDQETRWTKQLDKAARWRTQADAERLFKEVGNAIRAEKGLAPVLEYGR